MQVLAPDELVERICEEIAYAGGSLTSVQFWSLVSKLTDTLDKPLKSFVLRCFDSCQDTSISRYQKLLKIADIDDQIMEMEDLVFSISEDKLYLFLTGYNKRECSVGGLAFELLLEIAKAKERGINTMDLARQTSQDPRSITGRVKKLGNLVTAVQTIYKGHVVKHLRFHKFSVREDDNSGYASMKDSLQSIVDVVKHSKNGVRQVIDLKRELKFDKNKRQSKAFIAAISSLDAAGFLKKVLVVSPSTPSLKIRCVKYLRDYVPEERSINDFEDESELDEENEDNAANDECIVEDEEKLNLMNADNASQLLQSKNLLVEEDTNSEPQRFLLNRFQPLQNQTFGLVDKEGTSGLSSMQCVTSLTGSDYKRSFAKCSEYFIDTVGKEKKDYEGFGLVKVYDFEGKRKFYRLFTKPFFRLLASEEGLDANSGMQPLQPQLDSLRDLSSKHFSPLSNTLRFIVDEKGDHFFWNGELKAPANENAAPRGRKRKEVKLAEVEHMKASKKIKADEDKRSSPSGNTVVTGSTSSDTARYTPLGTAAEAGVSVTDSYVGDKNPSLFSIGGFSAKSLKSLQRQRAILRTIKKLGGVALFRDQFFEEVTKLMDSKTTLDKKTIRGDLELLKAARKLEFDIEKQTGRKIIYLPNTSSETISTFLNNEKDNKRSYFNDVIEATDIYFFDSDQREKFHSGSKSAERIEKFEKKGKRGRPTQARNKKVGKKLEKPIELTAALCDSTAERQSLVQSNMAQQASKSEAGQECYNVGSKAGLRALVISVVLTEVVRGEILWDLITGLFPNNSLGNLEKQWTTRRIRMGLAGWKALKMKWRKILVGALKEERATMEDIENLNLPKLIRLWESTDLKKADKSPTLLKNHEENMKKFTFVKETSHSTGVTALDLSSMVQRESALLRKCYTYVLGKRRNPSHVDEDIKTIIRSSLLDTDSAAANEIEALKNFDAKVVDRVVLDMAKEKLVVLSGSSKLQLNDGFVDQLRKKGEFEILDRAPSYIRQLQSILHGQKGVILKEELGNHAALIYLDLLQSNLILMKDIPVSPQDLPMHYTTRKYGFDALMPPLIVLPKLLSVTKPDEKVRVPMGAPFSRLWIDGYGALRGDVWKSLVFLVLNEVFFNPGLTIEFLAARSTKFMSPSDVEQIAKWCLESKLIRSTNMGGLIANSGWYMAF
ncbi:LAFA_0E07668g1_1 [Lachancea sp. 'fantastica']|nr:LAFA_0E07668g1_1 [Lachancea sp. 'fantastica']